MSTARPQGRVPTSFNGPATAAPTSSGSGAPRAASSSLWPAIAASAQMSRAARWPTALTWSSGPAAPPTTSSGPARRSDRLATVGGPAGPPLPYLTFDQRGESFRLSGRLTHRHTLQGAGVGAELLTGTL